MSERVGLVGIGSFAPEGRLTNADLERMVDTSDDWIWTRTGIRERRRAESGTPCSTLALEAARRALLDAGLVGSDINLFVLGTTSPDMMFPSTAGLVAHQVGARGAPAFDLTAACSGFVFSATVVWQAIRSGDARRGMAMGAETLSKYTDYTDRGTCVLFGDGAGAAILEAGDRGHRIIDIWIAADAEGYDALYLVAGGSRAPKGTPEGAKPENTFIQLKGREVYKIAVPRMAEAVQQTLHRNGMTPGDLAAIVPHQMNSRMLEALSERIPYPLERIVVNIERYGNTSSASIPLALDEAYRAGRFRPGDRVLLLAFGGGFTWGAILLEW